MTPDDWKEVESTTLWDLHYKAKDKVKDERGKTLVTKNDLLWLLTELAMGGSFEKIAKINPQAKAL